MGSMKMKCALIYDFDGTLAEGDCAQHGLMPALGIENIGDFWTLVKDRAKKDDGDEILSYLGLLAEKAHSLKSDELSYSNLVKHGQAIPLFPGVVDWFGDTDIPSMKMVRHQGGFSIAVLSHELSIPLFILNKNCVFVV
ncbi:hypothetical protein QNM34_08965 [Rahnella bonaserana]|uniref:hypothetical protein n=1 Tax=Rahnella bonaserana TaxID=2816248 RepID=UPI0024C26A82|nr:hypothetical protein [Rahnella bonaserana]WHZ42379.1 hypothetical protein QNM34_08965 [Rahnella bonaserana]